MILTDAKLLLKIARGIIKDDHKIKYRQEDFNNKKIVIKIFH
jgi:hypothetical protein